MKRTLTLSIIALSLSDVAVAQTSAPTLRQIGEVTATSSDTLYSPSSIRHLPNGKLLVNDVARRQLVLLDDKLSLLRVIADTMPGSPNTYGSRAASLIPYKGDSSLFIDASSLSMLVLDGEGNVGRVASIPRSSDAGIMATSALGGMGFDGERIVYRGSASISMLGASRSSTSSSPVGTPSISDTMPIVRVNVATRKMDTVAFIKVSTPKTNLSTTDGNFTLSIEINPLPVVDEYTVLADGRIAIVRGREYRVDFIDDAGTITVGPKIPFEWKRLSDEDKAAFIDSVKVATERAAAEGGGSAASRVGSALGAAFGGGGAIASGGPVTVTSVRVGSGSGAPTGGSSSTQFRMAAAPTVSYVNPSDLPDYQPAFFGNQVRGDMDGNVWVRIIPPKPIAGGPVYDVINGKGELIDRVQIPVGRTITGFGKGGVVYMSHVADGFTKLEKASSK